MGLVCQISFNRLRKTLLRSPRGDATSGGFTKTEKAQVKKSLAASALTYRKLIKELVHFAHRTKNNDDWPEHVKADITDDAHFSRLSAHSNLIQERGGFQREEAILVLTNDMWETKERCAVWLRTELKLLRDGEARTGAAPVRNRLALSRNPNCRLSGEDARMS